MTQLDRSQLDENSCLIPTIKGGVQTFQDITNAYKVLQPYWRNYMGGFNEIS